MNDKSIRNILIAYLKAKYSKIRIYQEKNIGSAVCNLSEFDTAFAELFNGRNAEKT